MSSPRLPLLFLLILLCTGACLPAWASLSDDSVIAPPPMPQPASVSVYQGKSAVIQLRVVGRTSPPLKFFIRTQPRHGSLSNLHIVSSDAAEITYTHTDADGPGADTFTYAAQAPGTPVSAPGRVDIIISEEPAVLAFDHALDFGTVYLGETSRRDLTLENTGGGQLSGQISVSPPWSVDGSGSYQLGRGGKAVIHLVFSPAEARKYLWALNPGVNANEGVTLEGAGVAPFEVWPKALEFGSKPGEAVRRATIKIKNTSDTPRTVQLTLPPQIAGPATLTLPASQDTEVALQTSPGFTGTAAGSIRVAAGQFGEDVPFSVFPTPASLTITPADRIDFGTVLPGRQYQKKLAIRNNGAVPVELHAEYPAEIEISPDPEGQPLQPGATSSHDVFFESGTSADYTGTISISVAGGEVSHVAVSANTAAQAAPAAAKVIQTSKLVHPAASIVLDDSWPPAGGYSKIPPVTDIRIFKNGAHFLELAWSRAPQAAGYKIEQRILKVDAAGQPKFGWQDVKLVKFREEDGNVIVRFDRLPAGRFWVIRVSAVDAAGTVSAPSRSIRIIGAPPHEPWSFPWWLGLLLVLGIVSFLWYKRSRGADRSDAERIARLGKS